MKPLKLNHNHNAGLIRRVFIAINNNRWTEYFMLSCTVANTIVLCTNWYDQPPSVDWYLNMANYGFAFVFTIEAILKIIALKPSVYFRDSGHLFDFFTVIASMVSSILSNVFQIDFGASANFMRAFRITRKFEFVNLSKQVKVMFDTVFEAIPPLTTMGGLLLLFMYIYSVLGVFLFADVQLQSYLTEYANFQSFGWAFLTLLRCATGEGWNFIMLDLTRSRSILYQCDPADFSYQRYV